MHAQCLEGIRFPRTRVTNGYELPYGCWKFNLDPLKEQPMRVCLFLGACPRAEIDGWFGGDTLMLFLFSSGILPLSSEAPCLQP